MIRIGSHGVHVWKQFYLKATVEYRRKRDKGGNTVYSRGILGLYILYTMPPKGPTTVAPPSTLPQSTLAPLSKASDALVQLKEKVNRAPIIFIESNVYPMVLIASNHVK